MSSSIDINIAARWMAKLAASDGVVSPNERKILKEFANSFGVDSSYVIRLAYGLLKDVEAEVEQFDANELKGRRFEEFVVSLLSDPNRTRLISWRGDKIVNGIYAADTLYPDLQILHKLDIQTVEYFVECKYRSSWNNGVIDFSSQFLRYHFHAKDNNKELFIALGVGGSPSNPDEFYIIPGRMIGYDKTIKQGRFKPCLCASTPDAYHNYINHYYNRRIFKVK